MTKVDDIQVKNMNNDSLDHCINESTALTQEITQKYELVFHDDDANSISRHHYGKITPFEGQVCGSKYYSNPQPPMLIFTLVLTLAMEYLVVRFIFVDYYSSKVGPLMCLYILYLLFTLAFSDPGFAFMKAEEDKMKIDLKHGGATPEDYLKYQQKYRYYCSICKISKAQTTKHCNMCEVCIDQYDHHCVFIGKCVGRKNLCHFQQFLFFIFSTLLYTMFLAFTFTGENVQRIN